MKVTVRVPATTANLGPGFDCLGMALDFYNTISVESDRDFSISVSGEGEGVLAPDRDNVIYKSIGALYEKIGGKAPEMAITCQNEIPVGRGLGSSASAIVGGLLAGNVLAGSRLTAKELLTMAADIEGHADNVTPALLGGFQIVVRDGDHFLNFAAPFPERLQCVLFIPDFQMPTYESRALLAPEISRQDAVFNIGRTALLVAQMATGKLDCLGVATKDRLHQPARQKLFPAMPAIFEAALSAGAKGVFLSGGGPTVLALAEDKPDAIGQAMKAAAAAQKVGGAVKVARPSVKGAHVVD